jgi:hypothetical protein
LAKLIESFQLVFVVLHDNNTESEWLIGCRRC